MKTIGRPFAPVSDRSLDKTWRSSAAQLEMSLFGAFRMYLESYPKLRMRQLGTASGSSSLSQSTWTVGVVALFPTHDQ